MNAAIKIILALVPGKSPCKLVIENIRVIHWSFRREFILSVLGKANAAVRHWAVQNYPGCS